jgi:predicted TIM-barrel fold metal-dependent hydrolase
LEFNPDATLDMSQIGWLWDELEKRKMVLAIDLGAVGSRSYQTGALRGIAREHPGLKIVISHLGQPSPAVEGDPGLWHLWQEQIELGKLPNVWFDTASLPSYVPDEAYPYPGVGRYTRKAIDRIGPAKVMWGTDIPGMLLHATYPQLVELGGLHTQFLSPPERAMVLGGNAMQVYNWHGTS